MGSSSIVVKATTSADRDRTSVAVDKACITVAGFSAETSEATTGVGCPALVVLKSTEIALTVSVCKKEFIASTVVVVVTGSWITAVDSLAFDAADTRVWKHARVGTDLSVLASASAVVVTVCSSSSLVASSRVMSGQAVAVAFGGQANSSEKSSNSELHFFVKIRI